MVGTVTEINWFASTDPSDFEFAQILARKTAELDALVADALSEHERGLTMEFNETHQIR